ncbi:variant erythrocyte surface antigen-1 family protein [Babesia caballi]|uniref:Variant erythrocyte surface antigen-1 family protein n=1 Tax=Babesia caballi TaxID=5871 RepID=A0AAV4LV60_BABCB|nr:variant erythrocyte surface antigen-1 family protein [Babesia caballi]
MSYNVIMLPLNTSHPTHSTFPFDCPSNLKDAIVWILRVTGKDGGGDGNKSEALAKAVVNLPDFNKAVTAATRKLQESGGDVDSVSQALGKLINEKELGHIIKQLADGLKGFIGYDGQGKMTGSGIGQRPKNKNGQDYQSGKPYESRDAFLQEYNTASVKSNVKGYYLSYNPSHATWGSWDANSPQAVKCAMIFIGTIPLIFNKLSYLYWRCHSDGGGWNGQSLINGDLGNFIYALDYHRFNLNDKMKGSQIVSSALNQNFTDFSDGMNKAQKEAQTRFEKEKATKQKVYSSATSTSQNSNPTYLEFRAGCNEKLNEKIKSGSASNFNDYPLSALHLLASCYFRCQQSKRDATSSRPPSTIREMLYFLAALPYSPNYDSLNAHISNHFKSISPVSDAKRDAELMIAVADSSTTAKHNTLSAADLKYHLISTCSFSTAVLGMIQGPGASKGESWLYELYCNSVFNLKYPSGSALFNALAKYSYAIQFQMTFLYWQCYNNGRRRGWQYCWFGSEIKPKKNDKAVPSHLCHADCTHNSGRGECIEHKTLGSTQCGRNSNHSPLQSFLTDCLSGFCRKIPGASNHLTTCLGPCHVPMGFRAEHLRGASKIGWNVMAALIPFCSSDSSPLTQLSEKLGCLTKRTPRTLGDLFGFTWHLNGQLFKNERPTLKSLAKKLVDAIGENNPSKIIPQFLFDMLNQIGGAASGGPSATGLSRSLEAMAPAVPFLYQVFMAKDEDSLPLVLFDLYQQCHKLKDSHYKHIDHSGQPCSDVNDLWSLWKPVSAQPRRGTDTQEACRNGNCGGYLSPSHTFSRRYVCRSSCLGVSVLVSVSH